MLDFTPRGIKNMPEELKKDDKNVINPFLIERDRPTIYYEKQKTNTTDKIAQTIRVTAEDSEKAFEIFQKVKKEVKL